MKTPAASAALLHTRPSTYIAGLDGLRAIAVVAVMIFHADLFHFLPGGFLGVDVFFSISGFLITSLIFHELNKYGQLRFFNFYLRRAKRLLPALYGLLFFCIVYSLCFAPDAIQALQNDTLPSLFYLSNYWQLFDEQPYFERFGRPHALQHLWSLAIEGQFYLIWPFLLLLVYRVKNQLPAHWIIAIASGLATLWMAWLAEVYNIPYEHAPERLYFGTDTHAIGLIFGAFLASWQAHRPPRFDLPAHRSLVVAGSLALCYLIGTFFYLDESSGFLYRGGFASVAIATCLLIALAAHPGNWANQLLEHPVTRWLGQRSYSLYLWHWPIFVFLRPDIELPQDPYLGFAIRMSFTLVLADFSYRYIENPVHLNGAKAFGQYSRQIFISLLSLFLTGLLALFLVQAPAPETTENTEAPVTPDTQIEGNPVAHEATHPQTAELDKPGQFISEPKQRYPLDLTDIRISALGDSVMLGAKPVLYKKLPIVLLDAEVGRQGSEALKLIRKYEESHALGDTLLIHIGTNGYIYEQNLKHMLEILANKKRLLFINIHADRRWTNDNNALLKKYQPLYPNMTLIDWFSASENHPEFFVKDGIHLTGKGMSAYSELIRTALGIPENKSFSTTEKKPAVDGLKEKKEPKEAKPKKTDKTENKAADESLSPPAHIEKPPTPQEETP